MVWNPSMWLYLKVSVEYIRCTRISSVDIKYSMRYLFYGVINDCVSSFAVGKRSLCVKLQFKTWRGEYI